MRCAQFLSIALLTAAPLAAQQFEGTVNVRMMAPNGQPSDMKFHFRDGKQAILVKGLVGPMAGAESRIVVNSADNRMTMFIDAPGAPGGGKFKMSSPIDASAGNGSAPDVTVRKLSSSQTVAGMRCDDYEITSGGRTTMVCSTEALGRFTMPGAGGPRNAEPEWARAFGNRAFFPLKVWSGNTTVFEVLAIDRARPDSALFDENTPGYMAMPGMPGPRRN
jgi:hypothetical protein